MPTINFLHIGKNAGTQIRYVMAQVMEHDPNLEFQGHPHKTRLIDLPARAPYFFSIREPVSRFKSGFYSRKRKGQPRLNVEWSPDEKIAFETFPHANDYTRLPDLSERARANLERWYAQDLVFYRMCNAWIAAAG